MLDEKIARVKDLIEKREAIDAELAVLLGVKTRGRPRKPEGESGSAEQPPSNG